MMHHQQKIPEDTAEFKWTEELCTEEIGIKYAYAYHISRHYAEYQYLGRILRIQNPSIYYDP